MKRSNNSQMGYRNIMDSRMNLDIKKSRFDRHMKEKNPIHLQEPHIVPNEHCPTLSPHKPQIQPQYKLEKKPSVNFQSHKYSKTNF